MASGSRSRLTLAAAAIAVATLVLTGCPAAPKTLNSDLPAGNLDVAELSANGTSLRVKGWAADRNASSSIKVVVELDGKIVDGLLIDANKPRSDVKRIVGTKHNPGFEHTLKISKRKKVRACVIAVNVGPGAHTELGCTTVAPKAPVKPAEPVEPANIAPVATFSADVETGAAPLLVNFDASASSDSDGTIASYDWDFDDFTTNTGATTSNTFGAGTYTITLTVTDDDGATSSTTKTITATGKPRKVTGLTFTSSGIDNGERYVEFQWDPLPGATRYDVAVLGDINPATGADLDPPGSCDARPTFTALANSGRVTLPAACSWNHFGGYISAVANGEQGPWEIIYFST